MKINEQYLKDYIHSILNIDSPSGFCKDIIQYLKREANAMGYPTTLTNKGALIITVEGTSDEIQRGVCAHVDTLGAMVRSISSDGTIKYTLVGGPLSPTMDSEYCTIYTRNGKTYTGTFICDQAAAHVHKNASSEKRTPDTMHIRLDEIVNSKEDVNNLGIENGDFICLDTKTQITHSGFVKSRFLDDKASVACLFTLLKTYSEEKLKPAYTTHFFISNYEEVGHGASYLPKGISEMMAVDMGCIGEDLSCTEMDVSICVKDSSGPYDYDLVSLLISLSQENNLSYKQDIYPMYGSDVSASLRAGNDIKGCLIGPGVSASHGMERTHLNALKDTIRLTNLYLQHKY